MILLQVHQAATYFLLNCRHFHHTFHSDRMDLIYDGTWSQMIFGLCVWENYSSYEYSLSTADAIRYVQSMPMFLWLLSFTVLVVVYLRCVLSHLKSRVLYVPCMNLLVAWVSIVRIRKLSCGHERGSQAVTKFRNLEKARGVCNVPLCRSSGAATASTASIDEVHTALCFPVGQKCVFKTNDQNCITVHRRVRVSSESL